jgi:hypothetical protein
MTAAAPAIPPSKNVPIFIGSPSMSSSMNPS